MLNRTSLFILKDIIFLLASILQRHYKGILLVLLLYSTDIMLILQLIELQNSSLEHRYSKSLEFSRYSYQLINSEDMYYLSLFFERIHNLYKG